MSAKRKTRRIRSRKGWRRAAEPATDLGGLFDGRPPLASAGRSPERARAAAAGRGFWPETTPIAGRTPLLGPDPEDLPVPEPPVAGL